MIVEFGGATMAMLLFIIAVLAKYSGVLEKAERGFAFIMSGGMIFILVYVFEVWGSGTALGGLAGSSAVDVMGKLGAIFGLLGWLMVLVGVLLAVRDFVLPAKY